MTPDLDTVLKLLQAPLAALLIIGGIQEWYVWGPTYRRVIESEKSWKEIALRSLNVAERK